MDFLWATLAQAARKPGVTCNWSLLAAVALPILAFCLSTLRWTIGSEDRLQAKYGSRRQAARAKLQGEYIVPALAKLLAAPFDNDPDRLLDAVAKDSDLEYSLESELASADYLPRLHALSDLYSDHDTMERLQDQAKGYDWRAVPFLVFLMLTGLYFAVALALKNSPFPTWSKWVSGVASVATFGVVLGLVALSLSTMNQLARVLRKYE